MEKVYLVLVVGIIGGLLTFARRYNNNDRDAGMAITGWTLFIIILILF